MATGKTFQRSVTDDDLMRKYGQSLQQTEPVQKQSSKDSNNNTFGRLYGPESTSTDNSTPSNSQREEPQKPRIPKKNFRRRRRATLADLRYIDIPKTIPESEEQEEEEEEYNEFSFKWRSKSSDDMNIQGFHYRQSQRNSNPAAVFLSNDTKTENAWLDADKRKNKYELESSTDDLSNVASSQREKHRNEHTFNDSSSIKEREQSFATDRHSSEGDYKTFDCEDVEQWRNKDFQKVDGDSNDNRDEKDSNASGSDLSDCGSEVIELKNAVSSYEISYIDGDDSTLQMSNRSLSSPENNTDSPGSQSPIAVEDLYETLGGLANRMIPRRRSKSIDAGILSQLPSISEERRKSSLISTLSGVSGLSEDVFESNVLRSKNEDNYDKRLESDDNKDKQNERTISHENKAKVDLPTTNKQNNDEKDKKRKQILRRWSTASLLLLSKTNIPSKPAETIAATPLNSAIDSTVNDPLNAKREDLSPVAKFKSNLSSKVLASKILRRRSIASLLPVKNSCSTNDSVNGQNFAPNTEDLIIAKRNNKDTRETLDERPKGLQKPNSTVPESTFKTTEESKNLVNALKQKVKATLRRRNSIASVRPWTGTIERSLMSSFDLRQSSNASTKEEATINDSSSASQQPTKETDQSSNTSLPKTAPLSQTEDKVKNIIGDDSSVCDEIKKEGAKPTVDKSLLQTQKVKDESPAVNKARKNEVKKALSEETGNKKGKDKTSTIPAAKKSALKKSLSLTSLPIKKSTETNANVHNRTPSSSSLRSRKMGTTQPAIKTPVRPRTPNTKTSQELKKIGGKPEPVRAQKTDFLPSTARGLQAKGTKAPSQVKSVQESKHAKEERIKNDPKEEKKTLKTRQRSSSFSIVTRKNKKAEFEGTPTTTKTTSIKQKNSINANKKNEEAVAASLKSKNGKTIQNVESSVATKLGPKKDSKDNSRVQDQSDQGTLTNEVAKNTFLPDKERIITRNPTDDEITSTNCTSNCKQPLTKESSVERVLVSDKEASELAIKNDADTQETNKGQANKRNPNADSEQLKTATAKFNEGDIIDDKDGKDMKKGEPERKTSVNVMRRRPGSPFTITIQYKPNAEQKNDKAQPDNVPGSRDQEKVVPTEVSDLELSALIASNTNDSDLDKELDNFGIMLGEIEKTANEPVLPQNPEPKATEVVPTDKRFAALSERYNAIMAKLSTRQHKKDNDVTKSNEKVKPSIVVNKYDSATKELVQLETETKFELDTSNIQSVAIPLSIHTEKHETNRFSCQNSKDEDINRISDKNKQNSVSSASSQEFGGSASKIMEFIHESNNGTSISDENKNDALSSVSSQEIRCSGTGLRNKNEELLDQLSDPPKLSQAGIVVFAENVLPVSAQRTESSSFVNIEGLSQSGDIPKGKRQENDNQYDQIPVSQSNEASQQLDYMNPFTNERNKDVTRETFQMHEPRKGNTRNLVKVCENKDQTKSEHVREITRKESGSRKAQELSTLSYKAPEEIENIRKLDHEIEDINTRANISYEATSDPSRNQESKENRDKKRSSTPSHNDTRSTNSHVRRSHSFSLGRSNTDLLSRDRVNGLYTTTQSSSSSAGKMVDCSGTPLPKRTSVIAKLMSRKLETKESNNRVVVTRKTKIFNNKEIQEVPISMEQFNNYRAQIELEKLKSPVKTEALSLHDILSGLNSSLSEMELIALCKECTRSLRTLDALGSLPSYLSPDTIIVNPSGTIKFKHLTQDFKIDELFLAPDRPKNNFSQSEKICVFSLAVTLWLAADWKLTEAQTPSLSLSLQDLLVSMTFDLSEDRPGFDSILQTCELLQTDEMTSRERCQALLWECQATKVFNKQNVDEKAHDISSKTRTQHAALMGSLSVAANVKGFLKSTETSHSKDNLFKDEKGSGTNYEHKNPKSPTSTVGHSTHVMDPNIVFSPINPVSGNPHINMSNDMVFRNQAQNATPAFVPIAVPVHAAGPSPVWYMTPTGMVPFSQMGQHPGYFVPLQHGSMSSGVSESDVSEMDDVKPVRRSSRPSTPTKSDNRAENENKRSSTPNGRSKIPRPTWSGQKSISPRPPSPSNRTNRFDTNSHHDAHKDSLPTTTSLYRSNTPPIKLKSGRSESDRDGRRSRADSPSPRSSQGQARRPSNPRIERSRPSSPNHSGDNSGSRPSSPAGSRSSSPVSILISKFENYSDSKPNENANSVSNLLNKFGTSSLLSEDRITKKHFRTSSGFNAKTGPLRPSSAVDQTMSSSLKVNTTTGLSRSWSGTAPQHDTSYASDSVHSSPDKYYSPERNHNSEKSKNSPLARDETSSSPLSRQSRNKLISSLEDLYESLKEMDRNAPESRTLRRSGRSWTSMENIYREDSEGSQTTLRKSSSAENLAIHTIDRNTEKSYVDNRKNPRTIYSDFGSPWSREKADKQSNNAKSSYLKDDKTFKSDFKKDSEISDLFRQLDSKGNIDKSERDTRTTSFLAPERDYQIEYQKDISKTSRHRFEIPVSIAIMDSESERLGHSPFSPAMFSPSAVKEKGFFHHPIKLEKDPPMSPPAPLSPSVKDLQPTSYFSNLSFNSDEMKPERDTSSHQKHMKDKQSSNHKKNSEMSESTKNKPMDGNSKPEENNSNRSKHKHSTASESGSSSSKVSSGNHSDYLGRFERRLSRKWSNSDEDLEQLGSDHNFYSCATENSKKDDDELSRPMNVRVKQEEKKRLKPRPLSIPGSLEDFPDSNQTSNSLTFGEMSTKAKPSSLPNTPTINLNTHSPSSLDTEARKLNIRGAASVPTTPSTNASEKTAPYFKYVSPNSSPKKTASRTVSVPIAQMMDSYGVLEKEEREIIDATTPTPLNEKAKLRAMISLPVEKISNTSSKSAKKRSLELRSPISPVEFRNTMSPTEPRSSTSSSSSTASSPRFPGNKFIFYSPQSETPERHLSPTEQVTNFGQKGFVITDNSRQKKTKKKEQKIKETPDPRYKNKPNIESSPSKETKSETVESAPKEQNQGQYLSEALDKLKDEIHYRKDVNRNIIGNVGANINSKEKETTETKSLRKAAPDIPKTVLAMDINKSPQHASSGAQERRRGSIDLREIYHQARRSSLAAHTDSSNSDSSNRPKSTSAQRPPSPGRVDSKELLGHFVKKVLNSTAKQPSPNSSHVDLSQKEQAKTPFLLHTRPPNKQSVGNENNVSLDSKGGNTPIEVSQRKSSHDKQKRKTSQEAKHTTKESRQELQKRRVSFENEDRMKLPLKDDTKSHKRHSSLEDDVFQDKDDVKGRRSSSEKRLQEAHKETLSTNSVTPLHSMTKSVGDATSSGNTTDDRRMSAQSSDDKDVLAKLVDMIHDEFAFEGYLDDGIEDVNMAEYVISLAGMDESMFKESISDQYSDLYWDEDLLQEMYILVNRPLTSRRPTLRFSESDAGRLRRPGSVLSVGSNQDQDGSMRSISRTSSERSFLETRDYVMSSLGEPSQFLPFKIIAPEMVQDIIEELAPVFEDYQKVMKIKLSPSISELLEKLGAKILEIGQQLTLERRAKRKNITSFNKLSDVDNKKDVKDLANKLLQEIEDSDKKIIYLKHIQRRLRNVYAERFGLDHSLLHSFVESYGESSIALEPRRQNGCLSFSPLWDQRSNQQSPECHGESTRGPVLQYGTKSGLLSYLFARHAMSQAYVRYFLYTYRYCSTPTTMFEFIRDKCRASLRADHDKTYNHQLQIRYRALDILAEWIHCCYQFDFKTNPDLLGRLLAFLNDELIPVDRTERGAILIELISEKERKHKEEQADETTDATAVLQTDDNQGSLMDKDSTRKHKRKHKSPVQCFKRGTPQTSSTYKPTLHLKTMSVIDHSSRTIAEQLTLIQQDVFSRVHSIHFLNSRTLGIGVGRGSPTKEASQQESMLGFSAGRRRSSLSAEQSSPDQSQVTEHGLFEGDAISDGVLETLLIHSQDVSMWVAVEICSAPSVKNQLVLIQKYISVAKYCSEMRNFATCVQVVDALEMFVVRQLPVWKQVPSKTVQTLEELKAIKVILKTDSGWLIKDNAYRERPTIPCALLFLMHVQQLELGGFTLANGMYKWTKMRSIARLIDQIRLFKQMRYAFEANDDLAARLRARIVECREENLHALAAENSANFHMSSSQSSRKFQEAFKKMKATFGNG